MTTLVNIKNDSTTCPPTTTHRRPTIMVSFRLLPARGGGTVAISLDLSAGQVAVLLTALTWFLQ